MEGIWWIDLKWNGVCDSKEPGKETTGTRKCFIHNINLIFYYIHDTAICLIEAEWKLN